MASTNDCVICCKEIEIFALGECNHPVCYNCMTRMRGLINQNECPICRKNLDKVIMSSDNIPYNELVKDLSKYEYNDYYKTYFVTSECQKKFSGLLENKCSLCTDRMFTTFEALRSHIRKQHELHFCDLCVQHIKLFPWERQMYTKADIVTHRRIGDKNASSHKGHPLCEYCDTRFFDKDALYKHLRTEHYFCHFCDADGSNDFYEDIEALRKHFKQNHFLCEEGNCINEDFTSVFRSEIDLKAHKATHHSRNMSKMESKSVRNLDLNFAAMPRGKKNHQHHQQNNNEQYEEPAAEVKKPINPMSEQDFPTLSTNGGMSTFAAPKVTVATKIGKAGLARTDENFPSLGPSSGPLLMPKSAPKTTPKTTVAHALKPASHAARSQDSTKNPQNNQNSKKDITNKKQQNVQNNGSEPKKSLYEDFPSLPVTKNLQKVLKLPAQSKTTAANLIEYSTLAKTEPKLRLVNTENAQKTKEKPKPVTLNINSDLNFPSLSIREKEPKSMMMQLTNNKPLKNKINTKQMRNKNNDEPLANNFTVLHAGGTLSPAPQYIRPPNVDNRNKDLKRKLCTILRDLDNFNEFELASKMYINNKYTAETYFEHCRIVLGENFNSLFPELLVLLPNAERQKALYDVLCMSDNISRKIFSRIKCCSSCGQVVLLNEVSYHERMHAANII